MALADSEVFSQSFISAAYARLSALVMPASDLVYEEKFLQALPLLEQARSYIEEHPEERWPFRVYVYPVYGFVLLELGRKEEAVDVLSQAYAARQRIQANSPSAWGQILDWGSPNGLKSEDKMKALRRLLHPRPMSRPPFIFGAERLFDRSFGKGHGDFLFFLGRALCETGRAKELVTLYEKHIKLPDGIEYRGETAAVVAEIRLFQFAILLFQVGRPDVAEKALERALKENTYVVRDIRYYSTQIDTVWSTFIRRRIIASTLYLAASHAPKDEPKFVRLLMNLLRSKGGGVRHFELLRQMLDRSESQQVRHLRAKLVALEDKMAALPPTQMGMRSLLDYSNDYGHVLVEAIRELGVPTLSALDGFNTLDLQQIRSDLGGQAVVGFMLYSPPARDTFGLAPPRYLRYCITADHLQLQDIGTQRAIDRAARAFRLDLISGDNGSRSGRALAQQLLIDLPRSVESSEQWIIDPDGALGLVPFEALPDADGCPALVRRSYRYVTSLGQLRQPPPSPSRQLRACIIANPAYGTHEPVSSAPNGLALVRSPANLLDLRELSVAPLPDTVQEAQAVASELARIGIMADRFEGARATCEALSTLRSPVVLHVASHAVIFSSTETANDQFVDDRHNAVDMVIPGRRAGLVLSDGDRPALLLAKDISRLPLQDAVLVVLSACNTGNGDVVQGEGVASLRRAVELAGARSSVTALWAVPSQATTELMASFYQNISRGLSLAEALRRAKLQKARQGRPPLEWAGFVLTGQNDVLAAGARGTANGQARQTLL